MMTILLHLFPILINTSLFPFFFTMVKFMLVKALVLGKVALFLALKLLFKKDRESPPSIIKLEYRNPHEQPAYIVYPHQHGTTTGEQFQESGGIPGGAVMVESNNQIGPPFGLNMGDFSQYLKRSSKSDKMDNNNPMTTILKPK